MLQQKAKRGSATKPRVWGDTNNAVGSYRRTAEKTLFSGHPDTPTGHKDCRSVGNQVPSHHGLRVGQMGQAPSPLTRTEHLISGDFIFPLTQRIGMNLLLSTREFEGRGIALSLIVGPGFTSFGRTRLRTEDCGILVYSAGACFYNRYMLRYYALMILGNYMQKSAPYMLLLLPISPTFGLVSHFTTRVGKYLSYAREHFLRLSPVNKLVRTWNLVGIPPGLPWYPQWDRT